MALALHLPAEDDPSWLVVNGIAVAVLILVVVMAALLVIRRGQRRDYLRKWQTVQANVTRLDEHERVIRGGGPLTDRVRVLEDQLAAAEARLDRCEAWRASAEEGLSRLFAALGRAAPEELTTTCPAPVLTVIKGGDGGVA